MPKASSCMLVLPMMIAPAARSFWATGASLRGTNPFRAGVPALLGSPATSILSLMTIGTPPSGLHEAPLTRPASNAAAAFIAPASSSVTKALRSALALARASAAATSALLVIFPAHRSAAACVAVNPSRSGAGCADTGDARTEATRLATAALSGNVLRRPMVLSSPRNRKAKFPKPYSPGGASKKLALLRPFLGDKAVAQSADTGDVDLDDVAGLQIGRAAVGAHPDHVARPQRKVFGQLDDEGHDAKNHVVGAEAAGLLAVDLDDGLHSVEVGVGLDPRPHRLEGVGIFRAPQPAIGFLPAALADVVADGVAEHTGHRIAPGELPCLLADDDDQFALVVNFFGGVRRDHHVLVMCDQRVLRAVTDLGPVRHVRNRAGLLGGFLEMLEIVEADAIEGARDHRQLDLDVAKRMRLLCALPLPEGIAAHGHHLVALDEAPGRPARGGKL